MTAMMRDDEDQWRLRAACRGMDPEMFFPNPKDKLGRHRAAQICHGCPVRLRCRVEADAHQEAYGIWGGMGRDARTAEATPIQILDTEQMVQIEYSKRKWKRRYKTKTSPAQQMVLDLLRTKPPGEWVYPYDLEEPASRNIYEGLSGLARKGQIEVCYDDFGRKMYRLPEGGEL